MSLGLSGVSFTSSSTSHASTVVSLHVSYGESSSVPPSADVISATFVIVVPANVAFIFIFIVNVVCAHAGNDHIVAVSTPFVSVNVLLLTNVIPAGTTSSTTIFVASSVH